MKGTPQKQQQPQPQQDFVQAEKKKKYLYIMENVAENGYDTSRFNKFFSQKFSKFLVLVTMGA